MKIKKLADNINFMRLFFLKSSDEQVNQLKLERAVLAELTQSPDAAFFNRQGLEIVDCVLGVFLFEIYRLFRSGRSLFSKDQFQFKILYFFSRLQSGRLVDDKSTALFNTQGEPEVIRRRSTSFKDDDDESLEEMIEQLNVECGVCGNCSVKTKEDKKFKNLYKQLIEDIVRNIN